MMQPSWEAALELSIWLIITRRMAPVLVLSEGPRKRGAQSHEYRRGLISRIVRFVITRSSSSAPSFTLQGQALATLENTVGNYRVLKAAIRFGSELDTAGRHARSASNFFHVASSIVPRWYAPVT